MAWTKESLISRLLDLKHYKRLKALINKSVSNSTLPGHPWKEREGHYPSVEDYRAVTNLCNLKVLARHCEVPSAQQLSHGASHWTVEILAWQVVVQDAKSVHCEKPVLTLL